MKNKIIHNVFSENEIKDINSAVFLKKHDTEIQTFLGRTRLDYSFEDIDNLPDSILNKANDLIKEFFDKDKRKYSFRYFTVVESIIMNLECHSWVPTKIRALLLVQYCVS